MRYNLCNFCHFLKSHEIRRCGKINLLKITLWGLSGKGPNTSIPALKTNRHLSFESVIIKS